MLDNKNIAKLTEPKPGTDTCSECGHPNPSDAEIKLLDAQIKLLNEIIAFRELEIESLKFGDTYKVNVGAQPSATHATNCRWCDADLNDDDRRWCGEGTKQCRECQSEDVGFVAEKLAATTEDVLERMGRIEVTLKGISRLLTKA